MPPRRSDVDFVGILLICSVFEDSSFQVHGPAAATMPALGPTPRPALTLSTFPFVLLSASLLRHCSRERIRDAPRFFEGPLVSHCSGADATSLFGAT